MVATPPPAGAVKPSNLYTDLPSKTLWLGVPLDVDPNGAVLLADINQTALDIAAAESRANTYTASQVATRAPAVHSHTAAQITDFAAAANAAVASNPAIAWIKGMIVLWSGPLDEIGVGALAGWALCDGSTHNVGGVNVVTPNLSDRFIIGVGAKSSGDKNAPGYCVTSDDGAHTHIVNGAALTVEQLPAHSHPVSLQTGDEAAHTHPYVDMTVVPAGTPGIAGGNILDAGTAYGQRLEQRASQTGSAHSHPVSGSTSNSGGGGTHTHTTGSAGTHNHQLTSGAIRDTIPYFALAYIMKL